MTPTDADRLLLLVQLFVHPGRSAEFRRFETEAARIMRRHGGRIERVIRPTGPPGAPLPDEIHLVAFDSAAGFEAYLGDPELASLRPLRDAAISRTDVTIGTDGEPYPDPGARP